MLQIGHAAQHGQYLFRRAGEAERPRGDARFGPALLEMRGDVIGHVREPSAEQRFHDDRLNAALCQLPVQIFGIDVVSRRMLPVHVIELNLHEIPMRPLVHRQHLVEDVHRSVERKSQIADTARFPLSEQKVQHPVVDIAGAERVDSAVADRMQQIVVDIVHLQVLEGLPIHGYRVLAGMVGEVRQLGGDQEFFAGMTLQGDPGRFFRPALHVHGRRIEIVHSVSYGIVHQLVDRILVDHVPPAVGRRESRPAHTPVAEQRHAIALFVVGTVSHPVGRNGRPGRPTARHRVILRAAAGPSGRSRGRADSHDFQKIAAVHFLISCSHRKSP